MNHSLQYFEILFRNYYERLCRYACTYVRQEDTAEGIVKDVFVTLWEEWETIDVKTSYSGYLYAAVRNGCINYLQRDRKRHGEVTALSDDMPLPAGVDAAEELIARELEEQIAQLVDALPSGCRDIFKMSRYDNLSYGQIAEVLDVSVGTVKTQIFRALEKLRKGLADYLVML
ncbi:MAG: RNA polymerase sigma-70 factor [Bacteroidales bacterium]|nr:RNA polymerase sigma-70 factor [Bacteroidales bacterium]